MILSLDKQELLDYVAAQAAAFFPDRNLLRGSDVESAYALALERTEYCFRHITHRGYTDETGNPTFSHMHADQYSQFLYFFSNSLWNLSQNRPLCDKLLYLNRTLSGMFYSYKGGLPDIFMFGHPVGTILGNAVYSNFLVVFQGVTVNTSQDAAGNAAPVLGKGLFLGAGAKIIGNKPVGDRVSLGVDALVYDREIESDSVVTRGPSGETVVSRRKKPECMAQRYFNIRIE